MRFPALILALVTLATLAGCGQPLTRTEWESHHPWCKPIAEIPADDGTARIVYPDRLPSLTPSADGRTATYHTTAGVHILHVRGNDVFARDWQTSVVLP
jgi:hypothetical protein